MKKITAFLLAVFLIAGVSVFAVPYGQYDVMKILIDSGEKYQLDKSYASTIIDDLSTHAGGYPVRFDSEQDKERAIKDAKMLSEMLNVMADSAAPDKGVLFLSALTNMICYNLDIAGSGEKANSQFKMLLSMDPESPYANYFYGNFLAGSGKTKESIPYLKKALDRGEPRAALSLGMAYLTLGEKEQALIYLKQYKKLVPDDTKSDGLIKAIEEGSVVRKNATSKLESSSNLITKVQYITKYQDAPILKKYPDRITILYENDNGRKTSATIYFSQMSDDLKKYLGCEDKSEKANSSTSDTSSDNNSETIDKTFNLDKVSVENTDTTRITRQDVIALDTLQRFMNALNSNDEKKIKDIFPEHNGLNPNMLKLFKEIDPDFVFNGYKDSYIRLITVKNYGIGIITGTIVYSSEILSKSDKKNNTESLYQCIYALKNEKGKWRIYKLKLGDIKEDVFNWDQIMAKYRSEKIDNAYVDKLKKEYLDAKPSPKTVAFNGEIYNLAFVEPIQQLSGFINEYLPPGESFPRFNKMIGFYYYPLEADPIDILKAHIQQAQKEMPNGIEMPYALYTTGRKDTALACFVMVAPDPDAKQKGQSLIWEFNVYKCKLSEKKKATVKLQYAFRIYGMPSKVECMEAYKRMATQLVIEMYYTPIPGLYKKL